MKYKKVFLLFCVGTATAKMFLVETGDTKNSHRLSEDYALDPDKGNGGLRTFQSFFWEKNRDRLGNVESNHGDGNNEPNPGDVNDEPNYGDGNNEPNPGDGDDEPNYGEGNNGPNPGDGHDEPNYGDGNNEPNPGDGHDETRSEASEGDEIDEAGSKPGKSCTDETGAVYKDGDYWTCADGCNKCSCGDGFIASTRAGCVTMQDTGKPCTDEKGAIYQDGDSWPCGDDCNNCWCSDGMIGNTKMACVPNHEDLECERDIDCHRKGKDFRCSPNTHHCIQSFGECDDCEQCGAEMSCIVTLVEVLGSSKVCVLTDQNTAR